jgi:hypothetical protein
MSGIVQQALPSKEPVSLADAKAFLKINTDRDDALIGTLITAARAYCEDNTGLLLAPRIFVQYRDSFPFYPYFQSPYAPGFGVVPPLAFGYPFQANYPLPVYGSYQGTRSPFEIRLLAWPVTAVQKITYIGTDGNPHDLSPGEDFIVDLVSQPARLSPLPGKNWPISVLSTNAVAIYFTAGFNADPTTITDDKETAAPDPPDQIVETKFVTGIPQTLRLAILILVSHWYFTREPAVAGTAASVPHHLDQLLATNRVYNFDDSSQSG